MSPHLVQTVYGLNGTGLLPWTGSVRQGFGEQLAALLTQLNVSSSSLIYLGSVVRLHFVEQCWIRK